MLKEQRMRNNKKINNNKTTVELIEVSKITIPESRTIPLNMDVVDNLKKSIDKLGLYQAIMVLRLVDGTYQLITGYHRYTATKVLGLEFIQAKIYTELSNDDLEIMELEENIIRNQFDHFILGSLVTKLESYYNKDTDKGSGSTKGKNDKTKDATGIKVREIQRAKKLFKDISEKPTLHKHLETKSTALQNSDMIKMSDFDEVNIDKFIEKTKGNLNKDTAKEAVKEIITEIESNKENLRNENLDSIIRNVCYKGDSLEILRKIPANYFNHCITDIPYGIGVKEDMGKGTNDYKAKEWDKGIPDISLFEEIYRTIKPGGFFLTTFSPRLDLNLLLLDKLTKVGFDTSFNQLFWVHESNMNRAYQMDKRIDKKHESDEYTDVESSDFEGERTPGVAPMVEPIIIVQKPFDVSIAENAVNSVKDGKTSKGTFNYTDTLVNDRQPKQIFSLEEINKQLASFSIKNWSEKFIGNFLYTSKTINEKHLDYKGNKITLKSKSSNDKQNNHASVKPVALFAYLIKLLCTDKDSLILEPFTGSGTTLMASKLLDIDYFGIEREDEYYEIIKQRLIQNKTYSIEDLESSISNN